MAHKRIFASNTPPNLAEITTIAPIWTTSTTKMKRKLLRSIARARTPTCIQRKERRWNKPFLSFLKKETSLCRIKGFWEGQPSSLIQAKPGWIRMGIISLRQRLIITITMADFQGRIHNRKRTLLMMKEARICLRLMCIRISTRSSKEGWMIRIWWQATIVCIRVARPISLDWIQDMGNNSSSSIAQGKLMMNMLR